ncbi:uncharacterized protein LOC118505087 [Anopheles stephensi]|uniref:uncharacterized protein LOC118505087 n=1 Tax=Anopheles stephensi TaxID=30069 RepID=UPI0016589D66|nr:uncharacterized protein LOC118505087 [Anopheles stephensi]
MNNLPLSNDERPYRNQLWRERMQQQLQHQQQPHYSRPREVPEERDCTVNEDATRLGKRPTSSCCPEHPKRSQGRGRPRQEHPAFRLSHPIGDCIETEPDMDDTLSEFAGGWYTPRRTRASTMRPSTWKKLNQWLDAHQQEHQNEGMGKGRSMTELQYAEYNSSEEEENEQRKREDVLGKEKQNDSTQEPEKTLKEPAATDAQSQMKAEVKDDETLPKNRSIGIGYQFLKNLMMLMLYIIKTLTPVTYPIVTYLKKHIKTAIVYLWVRFFQPCTLQGVRAREDPVSMLIMVLMVPVIGLLGIAYCAVCMLYWLHRLFLIEP